MNAPNPNTRKDRVQVYVDGFNLYFGMLEAGYKNGKWLNLKLLATKILLPQQELLSVKYFTSRVSNNPDKQKRQSTYIDALESVGVEVYYGKYQQKAIECNNCGHVWADYNEKMTDVNIATHMLIGAYQDQYDVAVLISGDSDLVPPIRHIHNLFPAKRVVVAFPPKRHNESVRLVAKGSMTIGRKTILDSQFADTVPSKIGYSLRKPEIWP